MKGSTAKVIVLLFIIAVLCFTWYQAGKSAVYAEDYEYYEKTEALLDSINNWDKPFMNTVTETDVYYEYEVAREKLY